MKQNLLNILNTLGQIEVKGRDNLNKLLGCMLLLEKTIAAMKEEEPHEEQAE